MTKQNLTDITIVLDESGSMSHARDKTISAINEFISGQKQTDGECRISLITFNANQFGGDWYKQIWNGINIKEIAYLSRESYSPSGGTALYDALGKTIQETGVRFKNIREENRPSKVLFVIMTDGEENSSRKFTLNRLKDMITEQENKYSWNFLFLGADFSTKEQTEALGLCDDRSYDFDKADLVKNYRGLSDAVRDYRTGSSKKLSAGFNSVVKTYADTHSN
jgi:hypothetical protein